MGRRRRKGRRWLGLPLLVVGVGVAGVCWLMRPSDLEQTTVTVAKGSTLTKVLRDLTEKGVLHSAELAGLVAKASRIRTIKEGVYVIRPHATIGQVFKDLSVRVEVPVRCPEGYWVARTAAYLERQGFCRAEEYVQAARGHEGHLVPDTYLLPPTATAKELVSKQLAAYEARIRPMTGSEGERALTIASMVELEASDPEERRVIAGIIENRLKKNMRLEIDATVLFAIQQWKVLPPGFVHTVKSPYNTYEHAGLPPGPICSPTVSSVKAALNPVRSDYLFYVSKGHDRHLFARTYAEHQANIKLARESQP